MIMDKIPKIMISQLDCNPKLQMIYLDKSRDSLAKILLHSLKKKKKKINLIFLFYCINIAIIGIICQFY